MCRFAGPSSRMAHGSRIMAIGTSVEVAGSALGGALWGLTGICVGWAISASCEAMFLLPAVLRIYRHAPALESDRASESD